jgi:hypothetical protein
MDDPDGIMTIRTGLEDIIKTASVGKSHIDPVSGSSFLLSAWALRNHDSTELARLDDSECRSPRDKVGVFVTVHKLIVGGCTLDLSD